MTSALATSPIAPSVGVEWIEAFNPPGGQWKVGEFASYPPTYGNQTLGDAVFRIGIADGPVLNGFWPQAVGANAPVQQHFLDEGVFIPRGFSLAMGEFSGLITTHETVQPLFHVQFHPNSNVWQLFAASPANLYTQLGAQANPKLSVPAGISSKGFVARWSIVSAQDVSSGLWAQHYHIWIEINHLIAHGITAGNGGSSAIALPFRGYTNTIKAAGAGGTWDPYATSANVALRFGLYRNSGETGDGTSILDVRAARAWVGRRAA